MSQTAQVDSSTAASLILSETQDGARILTLNRPQSRNALSDGMLNALHESLQEAAADTSVRAVIIAAAGPVFCAGHDLREVRAKQGLESYRELFNRCSEMMMYITRMPQPVIAAVQGTATAAGCQLVASCDLAIASENAKFATPGVHIGLFCSTPMVALSRNVGRKQAMKMLLTGDMLDASDAAAAGLVNEVVPAGKELERSLHYAGLIASKSPVTLSIGKNAFYRQLDMNLTDAYTFASEVMAENMMKPDAQEGVSAFVEKRKPVWQSE